MKAYKIVKDKGVAVKKAARMYGVPQQTLRDRVLGKVDPVNSGNETLFSREEERTCGASYSKGKPRIWVNQCFYTEISRGNGI